MLPHQDHSSVARAYRRDGSALNSQDQQQHAFTSSFLNSLNHFTPIPHAQQQQQRQLLEEQYHYYNSSGGGRRLSQEHNQSSGTRGTILAFGQRPQRALHSGGSGHLHRADRTTGPLFGDRKDTSSHFGEALSPAVNFDLDASSAGRGEETSLHFSSSSRNRRKAGATQGGHGSSGGDGGGGGGGGGGGCTPFSSMHSPPSAAPPTVTTATGETFTALTVGDYATTVMHECEQRGLDTTATWLGELTAALSDELLTSVGAVPTTTAAAAAGVPPQKASGGHGRYVLGEWEESPRRSMMPFHLHTKQQQHKNINTSSPLLNTEESGMRCSISASPTVSRLFGSALSVNTVGGGGGSSSGRGGIASTPYTHDSAHNRSKNNRNSTNTNTSTHVENNTNYSSKKQDVDGDDANTNHCACPAEEADDDDDEAAFLLSRVFESSSLPVSAVLKQTLFSTALSLFHKAEFKHCYEVLSTAPKRGGAGAGKKAGLLHRGSGRLGGTNSTTTLIKPLLGSKRRAAFLGLYALFLDGEKKKTVANCGSGQSNTAAVLGEVGGAGIGVMRGAGTGDLCTIGGVGGGGTALQNPHLLELERLLKNALHQFPNDSYLLWLNGVVHRERGDSQASVSAFLDAVKVNPLLWCAWEDLSKEVTNVAQLSEVIVHVEAIILRESLPILPLILRLFTAMTLESLSLFGEAAAEWAAINEGVLGDDEIPSGQIPTKERRSQAGEERSSSTSTADDDGGDDGVQGIGLAKTVAGGGDTVYAEEAAACDMGTPRQLPLTPNTGHLPLPRRTKRESKRDRLSKGQKRRKSTSASSDNDNDEEGEGRQREEKEDILPEARHTRNRQVFLASPNSCPIVQQHMAVCLAGKKDHRRALVLFADLHHRWPSRLQGLDEYSNALFVVGDRLALSTLAQSAYSTDPFSATANVAVGNYYAVMRKHDRSVYFFKRAVHINPRLLSAWTLLGHEYLEIKNPNAAAEAYRAALRIEKRDYRAWHSLGQVYELHRMHPYALHYYWQAVQLRPYDARMWQTVAAVLETLGRSKDMLLCLEHAERCEDALISAAAASAAAAAEHLRTEQGEVFDGNTFATSAGEQLSHPFTSTYGSGDVENYATIVRTLARTYLQISSPKAITYMAKLIACEAHREEDEVHFLPKLVRFFTEKAKRKITPSAISAAHTAINEYTASKVMMPFGATATTAATASSPAAQCFHAFELIDNSMSAAASPLAPSERAEQLSWLDAATEYLVRLSELIAQRELSDAGAKKNKASAVVGSPPLEALLGVESSRLSQYDDDIVALRAILTNGASVVVFDEDE